MLTVRGDVGLALELLFAGPRAALRRLTLDLDADLPANHTTMESAFQTCWLRPRRGRSLLFGQPLQQHRPALGGLGHLAILAADARSEATKQ